MTGVEKGPRGNPCFNVPAYAVAMRDAFFGSETAALYSDIYPETDSAWAAALNFSARSHNSSRGPHAEKILKHPVITCGRKPQDMEIAERSPVGTAIDDA